MRFASSQGRTLRNMDYDYQNVFHGYKDIFGENFPVLSLEQLNSTRYAMSAIPECKDFSGNCGQSFHPWPTATGICHAYNGAPVREIYNHSPYMKAFFDAYGREEDLPVQLAAGDGEKFGLTFYLDANTR